METIDHSFDTQTFCSFPMVKGRLRDQFFEKRNCVTTEDN